MSIAIAPVVPPFLTLSSLDDLEYVKKLQQQAIDALEEEAESLPSDRRQQFLVGVRQHAGDILKFLDHMEKHGAFPFKIVETARLLFVELKEIGEEFTKATDNNHLQFNKEMGVYESFRDFQVNLPKLNLTQEHPLPSFADLLERSRQANTEMNIRGNMLLAEMTAGLVRAGGTVAVEAARAAFCNLTPVNSMICRAAVKVEEAAGHPLQKALAEVVETVEPYLPKNRALANELKSQFGIPLEKGQKYGENAFLVGTTLLPVPPLAKLLGRGVKPFQTASRFLREDSGAVTIPSMKGLKTPVVKRSKRVAFEKIDLCFHRLSQSIEELARGHPPFEYFATINNLVFKTEENLRVHLPEISRVIGTDDFIELSRSFLGKTPDQVNFVQKGNSKKIFSLTFPDSSYYGFEGDFPDIINSILGMRKLSSFNLVHAEVSTPLAIGRNARSGFLILKDLGETYGSMLEKVYSGASIQRDVHLDLSQKFYQAGLAYGELHAKNSVLVFPGNPIHKELVRQGLHLLDDLWDGEYLVSESLFKRLFAEVEKKLSHTPLKAGFTHGDAHLENLVWNSNTQKVGFIDLEFVMHHVTLEMEPSGLLVREYFDIINDIMYRGIGNKVPRKDLVELRESFKRGYKAVYEGEHPGVEKLLGSIGDLLYPPE